MVTGRSEGEGREGRKDLHVQLIFEARASVPFPAMNGVHNQFETNNAICKRKKGVGKMKAIKLYDTRPRKKKKMR